MRATFLIREGHDVLGLFLLRLSLKISGSSSDELCIFCKERNHVEVRVVKNGILTILGIDGSQLGFILAVWLKYLSDWCIFVIGDVLGQLRVRSGKLGKIGHDCDIWELWE